MDNYELSITSLIGEDFNYMNDLDDLGNLEINDDLVNMNIDNLGDNNDLDNNLHNNLECNLQDDFNTELGINYDYRAELNKLKEHNQQELKQLMDNLQTVQEIINELKEREQKIKKNINLLDYVQTEALSIFSQISRKKF